MWVNAWLFILEAVAITSANAATIVIFTRTRRLHSKQYIMIINQAVADLLVGLFSIPMFVLYKISGDTRSTSIPKKLFLLTDGFFAAASLFGLAALAIERAHATYFPFRHSTLGKGPYIIGIVLMWTAPFALGVNQWMYLTDMTERMKVGTVFISFTLAIICAAYFLIVLKVRCKTTQVHDVTIQENKKLTVTLAIVTVLSLVTWLPFQVMLQINIHNVSPFFHESVKFVHYGNSLVNSVVYAFRMREIKREILRAFRCCLSNQVSSNNDRELRNT